MADPLNPAQPADVDFAKFSADELRTLKTLLTGAYAGFITAPNNQALKAKTAAAVVRDVLKMTAADALEVGHASHILNLLGSAFNAGGNTILRQTVPITTSLIISTGGTDAILSAGQLDRISGATEVFDFVNTGAGVFELRVNGVRVITIAGDVLTGELRAADVAPTSVFSIGFRGLPPVTLDANGDLLLTYGGKMVRHTNAGAHAWTIQPFATIAHPIGTAILLRNFNGGNVTITRGAGVSLRAAGSATDENKILTAYGEVTVLQEDTNVWVLSGQL